MPTPSTGNSARTTVFAPRIEELLRKHRGADLFRLERDTVGVAGAELMDGLLSARPANAEERPTFKPVQRRHVTRTDASALMQAVSADVRAALKKPLDAADDLTGKWPHVAHVHLRNLVFGRESFRFRILVDRRLELTPKLTWMAVAAGTAMLGKPGTEIPLSNLAARALEAEGYDDRRYAMYLYRRVAAPICFTVAALVTNALWLGSPFDDDVPNRDILSEALRLLPPPGTSSAWPPRNSAPWTNGSAHGTTS